MSTDYEQRLDEIIAEYLQAEEAGASIAVEDLLAANPEFEEDLREFLEDMHEIGNLQETPINGTLSAPATTSTVKYFGDYELLEEIARGGMGIVYKARQASLNRLVAVKMILSGRLASEADMKRFQTEAESAANLNHPYIVSVHEVGKHDGQGYFSMDFVDGENLSQIVRENPLPADVAAKYAQQVAEAIDYAHQKGTLHRDLKPSNVLIDADDNVQITDFGLALRVNDESVVTYTGQVLGTPSYMPPEQAQGNRDLINSTSDVYALGAMLYELVTSRPPFRGESTLETLKQVMESEPVPPRLLNPKVPLDLETICLKCLQKSQSRRYASAQELANDLQRFRNNEAITARPISQFERGWKWVRRRPATASLIAVAFVAVMLLVGLSVSYGYQIERERLLYNRSVSLAYQSWHSKEITRAQDLLRACPIHLRDWEWDYVNHLCQTGVEQSIQSQHITSRDIAYSPDGKYLAACDRNGQVHIWDLTTRSKITSLDAHSTRSEVVEFSPDGKLVATAGDDEFIGIWEWKTSKQRGRLTGFTGLILDFEFSQDGNNLASCGDDGVLRLWDLETWTVLHELKQLEGRLESVSNSFDGQAIATAGSDGVIRLVSSSNLAEYGRLEGHDNIVNQVDFSPIDMRLASADENGLIKLWDAQEGHEILTIEGSGSDVNSVCFSPDGRRLASGGTDLTVRIWDTQTGRVILKFDEQHSYRITDVEFHPDGQHVAAAGNVNSIEIFDTGVTDEYKQLRGDERSARTVKFSPNGELFATGGITGVIRLFDSASGEVLNEISAHDKSISEVCFNSDGTLIASASDDWTVKIFEIQSGHITRTLEGHKGPVYGVAFSPDGQQLASASHDGSVILWNTRTGKTERILDKKTGPVTSVAFSPDGGQLAIGGWDFMVTFWDGRTSYYRELPGHDREVLAVLFSADGRYLVSGDRNGEIIVWDSSGKRKVSQLSGHLAAVSHVTFSPSGNRIISSSWDGTVKVWDFYSENEVLSLSGQHGRVYEATFSPDLRYLASANHDGSVFVWGQSKSFSFKETAK